MNQRSHAFSASGGFGRQGAKLGVTTQRKKDENVC